MNNELVVNWHLTQACNFKCKYCFAKWERHCDDKEIIHHYEQCIQLLNELEQLPQFINEKYGTSFKQLRLNLVGGEPFLFYKKLTPIIEMAKSKKFKLSAVTNGSLLNDELISTIACNFETIGFSVDSTSQETNLLIGRASSSQTPMNTDGLIQDINKIRAINPKISIKINTVVSKLNLAEDFRTFINLVTPQKWKIFKMLPILTHENEITDQEFAQFIARYADLSQIICAENNEDMSSSYLMISPRGEFFQNNNYLSGHYHYSQSILKNGIALALQEIKFSTQKFLQRYQKGSQHIKVNVIA